MVTKTGRKPFGPSADRTKPHIGDNMIEYLPLPEKTSFPTKGALEEWSRLDFGLFIHWGLYALAGGVWKGEKIALLGEQIQRHASIPQKEYADLAKDFNPINFNAEKIADLAVETGMKYIVFTAKHHDGFCMFHTKLSPFNIVDATPFGRDPLKELAEACVSRGLKLGIYYSNPDWNYPGAIGRTPENKFAVFEKFTQQHLNYSVKQLEELLTHYGPICEIFFDMGLPTLEESRKLTETVHRVQPNCLVSGRVMNNQGDYQTLPDNHLPEGKLEHPWETPCTLYHTWGYKSWIDHPPLEEQVKKQLATYQKVVSRGGNFLLNIGPLPDGSLQNYEIEVLKTLGKAVKETKGAEPEKREINSRGFYNTLQYNSNIPKVEFTGHMTRNNLSENILEVTYRLDCEEIPAILHLGEKGKTWQYSLILRGEKTQQALFSDGNEASTTKGEEGADRLVQKLTLNLKDCPLKGDIPFILTKDNDRINDESLWIWDESNLNNPHRGPWDLSAPWTAHRKSMAKYSLNDLTLVNVSFKG